MTTLYLVGSVVAAATVNATLLRVGARWSFLLGLAVFGIGSVVCTVAPSMGVMLLGRTLQGAAGGLLAGLGYALITTTLPRVAVDPGVGAGVGDVGRRHGGGPGGRRPVRPVRFVALGIRRDGDTVRGDGARLVPLVLPAGHVDPDQPAPRCKVPVWSVLLLGAAALTVSIAQVPHNIARPRRCWWSA